MSAESDEHHERAKELANQLEAEATHFVTTRAVLFEIGNSLSKKRYREAAKTPRLCSLAERKSYAFPAVVFARRAEKLCFSGKALRRFRGFAAAFAQQLRA